MLFGYSRDMPRTWAEQSLLERMVTAVERVRDRLKRATAALEAAGVPYAVVGGNAVAAWVATIDPAAVRNTQDVDILLRREDLDAARSAQWDAYGRTWQASTFSSTAPAREREIRCMSSWRARRF